MVLHKWGEGFGRRGGGNAVRLRLPSENGAHEERGRTSSGRDTQKHEPLLASGASAAHADAARRELGLLGAGLDGQDVLDVHGRVLVEQAVGAAHDVRAQVQQEAARRRDGPGFHVGALVGVLVRAASGTDAASARRPPRACSAATTASASAGSMAGSWWRSTLWKKSSRAGGGATTRPLASSSSRSSTRRRARPRGTVTMRWPHMALAPPRRPHMKAAALVSAVKPASAQSASAGRYALAACGAGCSALRSSPWNSRGIAGSGSALRSSGSSKRLNSFCAPRLLVGVSL